MHACQDHPDKVVETVALLKGVVKFNPDLQDGVWLHTDISVLLCMMFIKQG